MDTLKSNIQKLCKLYNIYPSKSKGQNFLVDEDAYGKIIQYAQLSDKDTVLEIGPGFGTLTAFLAQKAKKVIAIEVDKKLVEMLFAQLHDFKNIQIVHGDILKLNALGLGLTTYKVVANLPYNITSHFLRKFLTLPFSPSSVPTDVGTPSPVQGEGISLPSLPLGGGGIEGEGEVILSKPSSMILMLQKEVAERVCAKTGEMSMLSFSVQFYAQAEIMENVSKENFWPEPKVDSAIIKIVPYKKEKIEALLKNAGIDEKLLFRVARWGFSSRRKQLHNNITSGIFTLLKRKATLQELELIFQMSKIHPQLRAQDLSVQDWLNLACAIHEKFKV